jgi:hypothetical protein
MTEEVRLRVIVDSDTPELLERLAASKRQGREVLHLMRLGLEMEKLLRLSASGSGLALPSRGAGGQMPLNTVESSVAKVEVAPKRSASIEKFFDETGLDADYFLAPMSYKE